MKLFPHQAAGVEWLAQRQHAGLFDEPGLGKTATAAVAAAKVGGRTLVCVPAVAAYNWQREILRWTPGRKVQVITASSTPIDPSADVVIVTHGMLIRPGVAVPLVTCEPWAVTILDEAHHFRTRTAQRTRAFYGIPGMKKPSIVRNSRRVWVLTGTPMANDATNLWTMLAALSPERITFDDRMLTWTQFRARYCVLAPSPYGDGWKVVGQKNAAELRERLKGFALRRLKSDHLKLPPLRWGTVAVAGDPEHMDEVRNALPPEVADAPPEELLTLLGQRTQFATWRRLCALAKVSPAVSLLVGDLEGGMPNVVIFAHHLEVISGLVRGFEENGISVAAITGAVGPGMRQQLVDRFQRGEVRVLICQLTAGGVAITLTSSSDVVFVEQSFVPGDNVQAADRLHRIGQTQSVLARVLTLAGSVDEVLGEILVRKTTMIHEVMQ